MQDEKPYGCNCSLINDIALIECVRFALLKVSINQHELMEDMSKKLKAITSNASNEADLLAKCDKRIENAIKNRSGLIKLHLEGKIDSDELIQTKAIITDEINALYKERALI